MFQLAVSLVSPFIGMNIEAFIGRKFYDRDDTNFSFYVGSCILLIFCNFILVFVFSYILFDHIKQITEIPVLYIKYVFIVAICQIIINVILAIFQVKEQPYKYGFFQILQSVLSIGLTLFFVMERNQTWSGRIEAQLISGVFFALISLLFLWKLDLLRINIKKIYFREPLSFGVPLIPHTLGSMMFTAVDRFLLTKLVGFEQMGNYSVAFQLGAVFSLFTVGFNNAYVPWLFKNLNSNSLLVKIKIVKFTYIYFILLCFLGFLVILIFPLIVSIFIASSFGSINNYSTFIVLGLVFQGMYFMVTNYIIYANKTHLQAAVTIIVGLLKIPITYFFIKWLGPVGAAVSFSITFLLFFISTWIISERVYPMPWRLWKILK